MTIPELQEHVVQCEQWVVKQHARACVAHRLADFLAALRGIAVNRTNAAEGLYRHARAAFQPFQGIIEQGLAGGTERPPGSCSMLAPAIDVHHECYRLLLPFPLLCRLFIVLLYHPSTSKKCFLSHPIYHTL